MGREFFLPLTRQQEVFLPLTVALAKLGCGQAFQDLERLQSSRNQRVVSEAARYFLLRSGPDHEPCRPVGELQEEDDIDWMRKDLQASCDELRKLAVEDAFKHPDSRHFVRLVPRLLDSVPEIRSLAGAALKHCGTRDPEALRSLFPLLEYRRPGRNEQEETEDVLVRRRALESLYYDHQSAAVQEKLLEVFDRPELGCKDELTVAFRYCPDPQGLRDAMLERTNKTPAAWLVLANFADPALRPRFHQLLRSPNWQLVRAGVLSLYPILDESDLPALQECRKHWL